MSNGRDFYLMIRVRTDDRQDKRSARDRVHRWLETYGYTSVSFGFDFLETMNVVERGKLVAKKPKKPEVTS